LAGAHSPRKMLPRKKAAALKKEAGREEGEGKSSKTTKTDLLGGGRMTLMCKGNTQKRGKKKKTRQRMLIAGKGRGTDFYLRFYNPERPRQGEGGGEEGCWAAV